MKTKVRIRLGSLFMIGVILSLSKGYSTEDQPIRENFEKKYKAWKAWVADHQFLSDYTENKEFQGIVDLGVPALPLIVEKIEKYPEDFHLEVAILNISKKSFDKSEWPPNAIGESHAAARLYIRWWKKDRFKTGARFSELYAKWRSLESVHDEKNAKETYNQIIRLGIPVMPFLIDKIDQEPKLIPAIAKLAGNDLPTTATVAISKKWWDNNKQKYQLPEPPKNSIEPKRNDSGTTSGSLEIGKYPTQTGKR